MISSTQENDVESLAADKALSDLSEEQLRDVLEQLTDHNLPDSEKCPLVRRLNAENASKDESDLVISTFCKSTPSSSSSSTCRNSGRKSRYSLHRTGSKDAEYKTHGNHTLKKVHSSQSLQDLISTNSESISMRSIGANRSGKRLNKASRANSFTMPSGSQNFCNNNNNNFNNKNTNNNEICSELSSPDLTFSSNVRTNSSQMQSQSQQSLKSNRNKNVKSRATSYISSPSVTALCENESNNSTVKSDLQTCDYESEVLSTSEISSPTYQECYATQSVHLVHDRDTYNMDCDTNSTSLCNSATDKLYSAQTESFELKDMRRKVNIIEYTSEKQNDSYDSDSHSHNKSFNSVDSFLDLGLKSVNSKDTIKTGVAERVFNHNSEYDSNDLTNNFQDDNKALQAYQGIEGINKTYDENNASVPHSDPDLANLQHYSNKLDSTARNANSREKKKKKTEPTKLAEQIEGHIGFKDVEYLTDFVNSSGSDPSKQLTDLNAKNNASLIMNSSSNIKENAKKKEKSITISGNSIPKRKNGNNVSPNQSACGIDSNKNTPNIPSSTSSSSFSSDEANSLSKNPEYAQKTDSLIITCETTSPLNSSLHNNKDKTALMTREDSDNLDDEKVNSDFSLISGEEHLYAASDSEMTDREKGFVTPKSKHLKRRKGLSRRINNTGHQRSPILSMQSSTSTTPSSSTVSGTGVYGRGYESEREFTEEYRQKEEVIRRKSTSSVPHSEQNSAYNSDGELSSHSMPVRNDSHIDGKRFSQSRTTPSSISSTPKASYADIAKSLNFGVTFYKRASVDAIYTTNAMIGPLSINTCVQYEDFPQLDLSLTPVADVSTPSSPSSNSKMIEALVSPPQKSIGEKRDHNSDSYTCSAPTSMTNTPIPQNECLFSETVKSNTETLETFKGAVVPPVIMCDYSDSVPLSDIGSVTFGFFDDLNTTSATSGQQTIQSFKAIHNYDSSEHKAKSPIKPSPETTSHVNKPKVSTVHLSYIDVDKKSFNYEHIIGFIKKAWDNAKRDYRIESYESTNEVK